MAKTSHTVEARRNNRVSSLVKAMGGWDTDLKSVSTALPDGKFGRIVLIETGGVTIDGSKLDVEFTVPFDDNTESNEAEIVIYNLSNATLSRIVQNNTITITAGYTGDTGIIFSGRIVKVSSKWSANDKVTTIQALDSYDLKERDVESIAFGDGVKASYVLRSLVSRLNLPIAAFAIRRDHTYTDGVTVDGGLMAAIKQYAGVCGVSAYINKGKVYVRHLTEGDNINFELDVDRGLIDSPEEFNEEVTNEDYTDKIHGMKVKMLLEHRITTSVLITLKSRNHNGRYRVREGQHVCTETDFYTEATCIE